MAQPTFATWQRKVQWSRSSISSHRPTWRTWSCAPPCLQGTIRCTHYALSPRCRLTLSDGKSTRKRSLNRLPTGPLLSLKKFTISRVQEWGHLAWVQSRCFAAMVTFACWMQDHLKNWLRSASLTLCQSLPVCLRTMKRCWSHLD